MSWYAFKTSPKSIAEVVGQLSLLPVRHHELASGPALDAALEAAELGFLESVGNGTFEITLCGSSIASAKNAVGYVIDFANVKAMTKTMAMTKRQAAAFRHVCSLMESKTSETSGGCGRIEVATQIQGSSLGNGRNTTKRLRVTPVDSATGHKTTEIQGKFSEAGLPAGLVKDGSAGIDASNRKGRSMQTKTQHSQPLGGLASQPVALEQAQLAFVSGGKWVALDAKPVALSGKPVAL